MLVRFGQDMVWGLSISLVVPLVPCLLLHVLHFLAHADSCTPLQLLQLTDQCIDFPCSPGSSSLRTAYQQTLQPYCQRMCQLGEN